MPSLAHRHCRNHHAEHERHQNRRHEPGSRMLVKGHLAILSDGKARQKPGVPSARKGQLFLLPARRGRLLLLRRLFRGLLAVALVLLGHRLGLARCRGLRGFVGTLLLIGHSISFRGNLKSIFRYFGKLGLFLRYTMDSSDIFDLRQYFCPKWAPARD